MKKYYIFLIIIPFVFSCERDEDWNDIEYRDISYEDFFNTDELKLREIEVTVSQSEWDRLIRILNDNIDSDKYVKANMLYRHSPGNDGIVDTLSDVGFRIRGNTTRRIPYKNGKYRRAHFKLKFDKCFDEQEGSPEYTERKSRTFADIEALNLKWGREGGESDVSQIREIYQYDMLQKAGVYVPKTTSCHLILNVGDDVIDYGVYTAIEPIDDTFIKHRLGNDTGDLYKCLWKQMGPATLTKNSTSGSKIGVSNAESGYEPSYDLKFGDANHVKFRDFVKKINELSGTALKTYLDENFDVDRFLRFTAMNVILGMPDDYWGMGNNYYLYFPEKGKILFLPYDYDHGLSGGWHPFNTENADIFRWCDMTGNSNKPLMKVLQIAEYKELYKNYLSTFALGQSALFDYSDYNTNYFQVLRTLYSPYLENDTGEGECFEHYGEETYFSKKKMSISSQL